MKPCIDEEVLRKYLKAGDIARRVLEEGLKRIREGARLIDICEFVENRIRELGGEPAFPCNISVNEVAAHYTPIIGDEGRIPEGAVVKLDVGVHVDGYIADTAATVDLSGKWGKLLDAAREALEAALRVVKPGVRFVDVAAVIDSTIRRRGFKPVSNLSGHSLGRYLVHAGDSIPNVPEPGYPGAFEAGRAYAIEPFATNGMGVVEEQEPVTIYSLNPRHPPPRSRRLREREKMLLNEVKERFRTLPFTERWINVEKYGGVEELRRALRRLNKMGFLIAYPVLVEKGKGIVSQFEHTIVVLEDQIIVTTGETP